MGQTVEEKLRFRRRHYIKHFKKWECDSDESHKTEKGHKSYNKLHTDQEGKYNHGSDSSRVECDNPKMKTQKIRGAGVRFGKSSAASITPEQAVALEQRLLNAEYDEEMPLDADSSLTAASTTKYPKSQKCDDGD